jgi:hypothetical protein
MTMTSGPLLDLSWAIAALIAFGGSILRGGPPRLAGGMAGVAWGLSLAVDRLDWPMEHGVLLVIDTAVTLGLVWMTRACRAPWLIFTAAAAVLLLANYAAYALFPQVSGWAFVSVSWVWSACILCGLIWGAAVDPGRINRP